jgi:aldose sugar dehydrogenase
MRTISVFALTAALLSTSACAETPPSVPVKPVTVVEGLEHPWSMAFLPNDEVLITERPGRLRLVRTGKLVPQPIAGVPAVDARGQGGLLDVVAHPDFAHNRMVYISLSQAVGDGANATRVIRARLSADGGRLEHVETVFQANPGTRSTAHFGSRLAFAPDGSLYITVGERNQRQRAQDLTDHNGSVIRLTDTGAVPPDNPFVGRTDARPEIFTWGHRNPQGLAVNPWTGAVWETEHGPRGGDEVNILKAGVNYGWPVITYGQEYVGGEIGEGTEKPGLEQPIHIWIPSIAPSGLAFYTGTAYPGWAGSLFVGALAGKSLVRLTLAGDRIVGEERLLTDAVGRIRDVREGPDGWLYLLTDEQNGRLLRLERQ